MHRLVIQCQFKLMRILMTNGFQTSQSLHGCHQLSIQGGTMRVISANIVCTAAIIQLEVTDRQLRQVFLHVKSSILSVETAEQNQPQGQRTDHCHCPFFVPPQIRPGHTGNGSSIPGTFAFLLACDGGITHPQSFHRRNLTSQPCRTQAGNRNRQPCKKGRAKEDHRMGRNHSIALQPSHQHRNQHHAQQPTQEKTHGDTDRAQSVCLTVNELLDLLCGGSQCFQLAIELDVGNNADLKNIINNQIAGEEHQYHPQIHGNVFLGCGSIHLW